MATVDSVIKLLDAIEKSAGNATKRIDELTKATEQLINAMSRGSNLDLVSQEALNRQQRMIENIEWLNRETGTFTNNLRRILTPLRQIRDVLNRIRDLARQAADHMRQFNRQAAAGRGSLNGLATQMRRLVSSSNSLRNNMRDANRFARSFQEAGNQAQRFSRTINRLTRPVSQVQRLLQQIIRHVRQLHQATRTLLNTLRNILTTVRQIRDVLNRIRDSARRAVNHMRQFNRQAQSSRQSLNNLVGPMRQLIALSNTLRANMQQVNGHIRNAQRTSGQPNAAQRVLAMAKKGLSSLFSVQNIKSAMKFSDNYMNSLARISTVNDGTQSDKALQAKLFAAANRSRGRYMEMTEHVAKLGLTAPQAFSSNDETIAFVELAQKAFRLGGAGDAERQAGMEQVIRAMAEGGLQGNDFLKIMDAAPELADAIASFTGKSIEELIALSAEGPIAADILKGALFSAADEINSKFEELPKTFGDIQNQLSVHATAAFGPVIERVNELWNSTDGQRLITGISQAIQAAAILIGGLIDGVAALLSFVTENWSIIEPILIAIGTVWLGRIIAQLWAMVPPLLTQFAAWMAMNWPILLLAAIIALVIYALVELGVTAEQIVGVIVGAFAVAGAFIWNVIAGVVNAIIQFLWSYFVEPFLGIIEWFINAFQGGFDSFGDAVRNLIGQIISWFLSLGKVVTKIIDAIFGTNWTDGLEALQDQVLGWGQNDKAITISRDAPAALDRIEYRDAWDAGYEAGGNLVNSVQNALKGFDLDSMLHFGAVDGIGQGVDNPGADTSHIDRIGKVNEVGRIGDTVDISSEDLKMMRELAEMNAIQNFVTLTPTVNVQTGDIRNGYDVDTIIRRIEQSLTEQIASSAQGVYGLG